MNYDLNQISQTKSSKNNVFGSLKKLLPLLAGENKQLILAAIAILINSGLTLAAPVLIGQAIDKYVQTKQFHGVLVYGGILLALYLVVFAAGYLQTQIMGAVSQRTLFNLRNTVFKKIQELPVAFFNQNKAGDLISRINNDTDKLNQFFSQSLMQFIGNVFVIAGAAVFILILNPRLGAASLIPALLLLIFTQLISPWIKSKNAINLKSVGGMSAEIQESLDNFKVIIAFDRRDYFRERFEEVNKKTYASAITAGLANNIFVPVYGLASQAGQLIVLAYGIYLITQGQFTVGLLVSFLYYINNFYNPLRQMAALWANFQVAMAGWDRIADILSMKTDLITTSSTENTKTSESIMEFQKVSFRYPEGQEVLRNISFALQRGKTYALVGPTGGGKTTTASLMARLYDPTSGQVLLDGQDIRSYDPAQRAKKIGFILQEPFLFTGTVRENISYGNEFCQQCSNDELIKTLQDTGLEKLLQRFDQGLETKINDNSGSISLGQKQLIAFMRVVLRQPEILILDEATANIDTVTEQLLEEIIQKLPPRTTKVIIAHRLNTIENADEIFFVNGGEVTLAGSMEQAVEMLMHGKRES